MERGEEGETDRGGWFSYEARFIRHLPIHLLNLSDAAERAKHDAIVALVGRILASKAADTTAMEREIDRMVYELYALSEEEVKIVEGAAGKGEK